MSLRNSPRESQSLGVENKHEKALVGSFLVDSSALSFALTHSSPFLPCRAAHSGRRESTHGDATPARYGGIPGCRWQSSLPSPPALPRSSLTIGQFPPAYTPSPLPLLTYTPPPAPAACSTPSHLPHPHVCPASSPRLPVSPCATPLHLSLSLPPRGPYMLYVVPAPPRVGGIESGGSSGIPVLPTLNLHDASLAAPPPPPGGYNHHQPAPCEASDTPLIEGCLQTAVVSG